MTSAPSNMAANTNATAANPEIAAESKQSFAQGHGRGDGVRAQGMAAFEYGTEAELFDYSVEAELFPARGRKLGRQPIGYRRFVRAADAIRFAIEELPPEMLVGAYLEVEEARFDSRGIRRLYDSVAYPLARRVAA